MDGNAHANCFWHDNSLRFAACGFAVYPVHEPRREMNYAISRASRFFVLGHFLRCGRLDCRCVWGKPDFDFPDCRKFLFAFLRLIWMLSIFQRKEKGRKTEDLASENSDTKCETGEVHSCFYLLKHFPKYSLFLLGLVFVFAAYNMNSTFLIDWIEGMGGNHADYGMAQFVLAMAEIPVALVFYRIRGRVSIDKLMVVCAFFFASFAPRQRHFPAA